MIRWCMVPEIWCGTDGQDGQTDGQTDGWTDWLTDGQTDGQKKCLRGGCPT